MALRGNRDDATAVDPPGPLKTPPITAHLLFLVEKEAPAEKLFSVHHH
jgi:hypothetical protein